MPATLTDRAVVRLSGPDCRSFLQGLITQDLETLQPGELRYGALLTPQGRLRWDLFLYGEKDRGEADGVAIDVAAAARDELIQALTLYRLRARVEIATSAEAVLAAWGAAPEGEGWRPDPRLPELGWRRLANPPLVTPPNTPPITPPDPNGDYRAHRLALGVADPAEDAIEPLYPIDANLDLLHGIDFKKGCFVGQETTSRMKRRGQIKTRIAPLAYDGPALEPGAEVMAGALRAGRILTGAPGRSLALLRIDRAFAAPLTALDRPVRLDVRPWLASAFTLETAGTEA